MNADQLFSAVNLIAVASWLMLIAAPYWKFTQKIIFNGVVVLLALAYAFLIIIYWGDAPDGGFSSL
ncbi:MAG: abscisic acid-deficient protein Aba4 family protein, partial [Chitinophagales bacterium]